MTIREAFLNIFSLDEEEFKKLYQAFSEHSSDIIKNYNIQRLRKILAAVVPYCEKFPETDVKIKRKVAEMLLKKLKFNNFDETIDATYERLNNLFNETTSRNINPYKIIYATVLTDGNLRSDLNKNKTYSKNRDFVNIYNELCRVLEISEDQEEQDTRPSRIFEKCTTLISKVYADRIQKVFDTLCSLKAWSINIFKDADEVKAILKNNPSLFDTPPDTIESAFHYLRNKMKPLLAINPPTFTSKPEDNEKLYEIWLLRNWIKNNSSLLTITADSMKDKEDLLGLMFANYREYISADALQKLFQDPVSLSIINRISIKKIRENIKPNLESLLEFVSENFSPSERKAYISNYLISNPYFLEMPNGKVKSLFARIQDICKEDKTFAKKFLCSGKTLFASKDDFNISEIFAKLINNNTMFELDVENLEGRDLLAKYNEVFLNSPKFLPILDRLIEERQKRISLSEKEVRKNIRLAGCKISDIKYFDDDKKSLAWNKTCIESMISYIDEINAARHKIEDTPFIENVVMQELNHAFEIEKVFDRIRDNYEQKQFKVGKKYINSDALYEKMMAYLGKIFDDKESISKIYNKEITKPFIELLKTEFGAKESAQVSMMSRTIEIPQIKNKTLKPLIEKLAKSIAKGDLGVSFKFEKENSFDKK